MRGHELTTAGRDAMAERLFGICAKEGRTWETEPRELRQEFRGFVDELVDAATQAEERAAQPTNRKGVLP